MTPGAVQTMPTVPLRRLCEFVRGRSYTASDYGAEGEGVPFVNLKCVSKGGGFSTRGLKRFIGPLDADSLVKEGDLLVANTDLTPGGEVVGSPVLVPSLDNGATISLDLSKLIVDTDTIGTSFLYFALCSGPARAFMKTAARGTTVLHLDIGRAKHCPIPLPSRDAQEAISAYLKAETSKLDSLIATKDRMVGLLEERVNSRILDLVGRSALAGGSDLDSAPIRRVLRKEDRWATDGEMVTAFRDGEVTTREARGRDGFTNAWAEGGRVQVVEAGDVVVHGLDGFSGAIGDAQLAGVCSPVYHVCAPFNGDGAFLGRMLRLLALDGYLGNFATSTRERAVDFRNWDLFGRIPIPVVPADVQHEIGDQIRAIRPLRAKILESEALAREHRLALITAAVTGQLEVAKGGA